MVNIYWLRPKIGDAVWLYYLLASNAKYSAESEWLPIGEGKPISDMELGSQLFCNEETIREWRERLERVGLLRCTPAEDAVGRECRKMALLNTSYTALGAALAAEEVSISTAIN